MIDRAFKEADWDAMNEQKMRVLGKRQFKKMKELDNINVQLSHLINQEPKPDLTPEQIWALLDQIMESLPNE